MHPLQLSIPKRCRMFNAVTAKQGCNVGQCYRQLLPDLLLFAHTTFYKQSYFQFYSYLSLKTSNLKDFFRTVFKTCSFFRRRKLLIQISARESVWFLLFGCFLSHLKALCFSLRFQGKQKLKTALWVDGKGCGCSALLCMQITTECCYDTHKHPAHCSHPQTKPFFHLCIRV